MNEFEKQYRRKTHKVFLLFLALHLPVCIALAAYTRLPIAPVLIIGAAILAGPVILFFLNPAARMTSLAIAVAAQCYSGLLIHSGRGMIELHFHVFVTLAMLIVMADWLVISSAAATIAVHHVAFFFLLPASVFNYQATFNIVLLHAFFVVLETVPACLIAARFGKFIRAQGSAIQTLREAAVAIAAHTGNLTTASQALAQGAGDQAASLEETSASIEEMASMTQRNAENARRAKELATETRAAAESNAVTMDEMSTAMNEIKAGNDNIAKIIKVIDEIAFQTNILALNAAVEAARAGEAGQGFAVVADEVRNLAQRSAAAAKETADKIQDSMQKGERGVQRSAKVGEGLRDIVTKTREVDNLVAQIATASQEQSQGITQVNSAVSQIDKITQSSASSAANTSETAAKLDVLANQLKSAVEELDRILGESSPTAASPEEFSPAASHEEPHAEPSRSRSREPKSEVTGKSF